ncbi:MAG: cation-translocating P-type ATPase [Actinobacteria bacterium]|nr:cation-translocating P-type ATPase [Actinomycetota bacterium]
MLLHNEPANEWYRLTAGETIGAIKSNAETGLSLAEVGRRLAEVGANELPRSERRSALSIFLGQFNDFMIWVLVAAALVSGLILKELVDAAAIGAILIINALIGFVQEFRAEAAIESLKELSAPRAAVLRDGREEIVPATELVPGDIILLSAGDIVPADSRLIEVAALQIDESSLTGESVPVHKETEPIEIERLPLGDRKNMVYLGTTVPVGRGKGVVVATGASTQMGEIARLVGTSGDELTPLQIELKRVGKVIALIVLAVAASVFLAGIATGKPRILMFLAAVSLAVAAIPEGLPAIVTVTLALGVRAMASARAIVRRLHAVETLGSTTFIATDKTGTLTVNRMSVRYLEVAGRLIDASEISEASPPEAMRLLQAAVLANDAHQSGDRLVGDPTETALIEAGGLAGLAKERLDAALPRIDEVPFDSSRKLMTTLHPEGGGFIAFTKGAPEILLDRCALSDEERARLTATADELAADGLRTLAVAERPFDARPPELALEERDFTFLGLIALLDPPRPEVAEAIRTCRQAGIHVAMVTGDHAATARAIGREIGLVDDSFLTGKELEEISTDELARALDHVSIFARVDPAHKLKIVEALKARREVVAMTGDGVNDAPALKKADIGVAMGVVGTEVAKEASDMVLADDNFATIVSAVRQGRLIFDNLKKFIHFLLSANVSEVLTMFSVTIVGLPIPLFPVQLLWINLITDGFPALALGVDPPERDLMGRRPRGPGEGIVAPRALRRPLVWGALLTLGTVGAFLAVLMVRGVPLFSAGEARFAADLAVAQTATFTTMVLQQLVHSLNFRSASESIVSLESLKNRALIVAIVASALLQLAVIYIPGANLVFRTTPLGLTEWAVVATAILFPIALIDSIKQLKGGR